MESNDKKLSVLDALAYEGQPMPSGLEAPEICYYISMLHLYALYNEGKLTGEQARQAKMEVIAAYNNFHLIHKIGVHDMGILRKIQSSKDYYSEKGCPVCKDLAAQICGLELDFTGKEFEV